MDVLLVVTVIGFALLCGVAVRRGVRVRGASVWLAVSFASIAVTGMLVPGLDGATTSGGRLLAVLLVATGLVLHPVALVQFSHALQPVPRVWRYGVPAAAAVLLVAVVSVAALDPDAFADDVGAAAPASLVLVLVALLWAEVTLYVGVRLGRSGWRLTSRVGRARALSIAAGVLGLGPAVAAPFLVSALDESDGAVFALAACVLITLGYAPPRWLRWTWSRRDTHRLAEAELAVLEDPDGSLAPWLTTVAEVWEADAVQLEVDGEQVAGVGGPVDEPPDGAHVIGPGVHVARLPGKAWLLTATVADARLSARTRVDPILLDDASELFLATAVRLRGTAVRRDLEAEANAERARRADEAHRRATTRLRDDVLSTLSHELRTPLVTLRGVPELLLRRLDDLGTDDVRALLVRMQDNALALHRMVESTMLLAQVRAGEVTPRAVPTTAQRVLDAARHRLELVGVDLSRVRVPTDADVPLRTDERLAAAVTAEVIHNALTYSEAPAPVAILVQPAGDHLDLVVADAGRGVALGSDGADVVAPFGRGGDLLTRDRRGLGVGLTLVTELAPMLDATVALEPGLDGGTTVRVRLPRGLDLSPRQAG